MAAISHRQRVLDALNHKEPDRVPVDVGSSYVTGVHFRAYQRLLRHLGLEEELRDLMVDRWALVAQASERALRLLDVDCRGLSLGSPFSSVAEVEAQATLQDEWGVLWIRAKESHYINQEGPFQRGDPSPADLKSYRWPNPRDPVRTRGLRERALKLRAESDCAIVLNLPYAIVRECQRVRGFTEWFEDLLVNPAFAEALMEGVLGVAAGIAVAALEEVGDLVDVVFFPDDLGIQTQPFVRPELYRRLIKPRHKGLVEAIKRKSAAKVLMHSDGSIYPLIPDLIDIGVDGLNPIQVTAKDMDSQRLKREFGRHMAFWGAIDTHRVLPMGTPADVEREVRTRIDHLAKGGGYVVASVHNIQAEVPPENILAMCRTAREYGKSPIRVA